MRDVYSSPWRLFFAVDTSFAPLFRILRPMNVSRRDDFLLEMSSRFRSDLMTSVPIDGIKRSNVCGDGYRIDGALLKSYPYSSSETYPANEDCSMTFQARRRHSKIRIRILHLDLNDIHGGTNCLDSLRFYQSFYVRRKEKLVRGRKFDSTRKVCFS